MPPMLGESCIVVRVLCADAGTRFYPRTRLHFQATTHTLYNTVQDRYTQQENKVCARVPLCMYVARDYATRARQYVVVRARELSHERYALTIMCKSTGDHNHDDLLS